jgi:hypothetical protein
MTEPRKPTPAQAEARAALRALRRRGWRVDLTTFGACAFEGRAPVLWVAQLGDGWHAHRWRPAPACATRGTAAAAISALAGQSVPPRGLAPEVAGGDAVGEVMA